MSQRKVAGQFCTPRPLADLLVRLTLDDVRVPVLDPCCGTGTIAKAVCAFKTEQGMTAADALDTTWASDKHAMPLQFATLALATGEAQAITVRVFQNDVALLSVGQSIPFVDATTGREIHDILPEFPCIVLNPPFVRFEDWGRKNPVSRELASFVSKETGVALDPKSDFSAPLILHLWRLCSAKEGRVGVVVSNSWLGTAWGNIFRSALLKLFKVEVVVTSAKGRWFKDAKVVTNLVILRKRENPAMADPKEVVTFSATSIPIEKWTPTTTDQIVSSIINKRTSNKTPVSVNCVTIERVKALDDMGLCWTAHFADLSWFDRVAPHLVPVSTLFDVRRGERRGWDDLFFPPKDSNIESCYLHHVLRTSSEANRLSVKPDGYAFCCSSSIEELSRLGHKGATNWIKRFAKATNEKGRLLPEVLARSGLHWYEMRPDTVADLAASMNYDRRLFILRLSPRAFVNQRLIRLTIKPNVGVDLDLSHALLCSLLGAFYIEALGFGRGLGVLDLNATKLAKQMRMLNPVEISKKARQQILKAFAPLLKRDILPFDEEMVDSDRMEYEKTILDAFGLLDLQPKITEAVLRLQAMRLTARENAGPNSSETAEEETT